MCRPLIAASESAPGWLELTSAHTAEHLAEGLGARADAHHAAAEVLDSAPELQSPEMQTIAELSARRNEVVATELSRLQWAVREADSAEMARRLVRAAEGAGGPLAEALRLYSEMRLALVGPEWDTSGDADNEFVVPLEHSTDCRQAWMVFEP